MKIFITASKSFYGEVARVKLLLESSGHEVTPPNGYADPDAEQRIQQLSQEEYKQWKANMLRQDGKIIAAHDAILVMNFEKHGQKNYIGGAVFLEMFKAFELEKRIFLYNPIPDSLLKDEIVGMSPIVIHGEVSLIQ